MAGRVRRAYAGRGPLARRDFLRAVAPPLALLALWVAVVAALSEPPPTPAPTAGAETAPEALGRILAGLADQLGAAGLLVLALALVPLGIASVRRLRDAGLARAIGVPLVVAPAALWLAWLARVAEFYDLVLTRALFAALSTDAFVSTAVVVVLFCWAFVATFLVDALVVVAVDVGLLAMAAGASLLLILGLAAPTRRPRGAA
ncbi:hypothetical protein [Jannaschia sp. W003]|uniref:hypothetical protein n=1 Tax=Jannaschia sp. W003 TaxID=2867012 RepID=UPI0021A471A1|nr:hypothetical protein [Jannaschia sp. W003]UWQ21695.1 hypothetical protein K3554_01295 [Jannaschia sp. W003]